MPVEDEGNDVIQQIKSVEDIVVISVDVGRELTIESKEDVTDRGEKELIIFHGSYDNLISSRAGDVMVLDVNREVSLEMVGIL